MPLRPRTVRRLGVLLVALSLLGGAGVWWHSAAAARDVWRLRGLREVGLDAYAAGDHSTALSRLSEYVAGGDLDNVRDDFDVRLALAVSRGRVASPGGGGRHLDQAARMLSDLLAESDATLKGARGDEAQDVLARLRAVASALLDVRARAGEWADLLRAADRVAGVDATDPLPQRMRRLALERTGDLPAALAVAEALAARRPADFDDRVQALRLAARAGRPGDDLVRNVVAQREATPDDPDVLLLSALAFDAAGQDKQAAACLDQAAAAVPAGAAGPVFLARLSGLYAAAGRYDRTLPLYEAAVARPPADAATQAFLRRDLAKVLWQRGRSEEALDALGDAVPTQPIEKVETAATRAMLLLDLGRPREAETLLAELQEAAKGGPARREAAAWSDALQARYAPLFNGTPPPLRSRVDALRAAVDRLDDDPTAARAFVADPTRGTMLFWLGDLYAELAETQLAVRCYDAAGAAAPGWAAPHLRTARLQLAAGRLDDAALAAEQARERLHPNGQALLARIAYAQWLAAPSAAGADRAAALAGEHQRLHPLDPATLPAQVHLTALVDPDAARALARASLAAGADDDLRVALATVSRAADLGLSDELLAGVRTPEAAVVRARRLAEAGDVDAAVGEFDVADSLPWQLARARVLETCRPAQAAAAWKRLGDEHAGDLATQVAILDDAESVRGDRSFVARTIDRLAELVGPTGRRWRLERARLLLADGTADAALAAVDLLRDLVRGGEGADTVDARMLLAEGLVTGGNLDAAADHLAVAYAIDPRRSDVGLRLIALRERQGRRAEARRLLGKLAGDGVRGGPQRLEVASRLAEDGQAAAAISLLQQADAAGSLEPAGRTVLAELLARAGRDDEAAALFELLLDVPKPSAAVVRSAATFRGRDGDRDAVERVLDRLVDAPASPTDRHVVRATVYAEIGDAAAARREFAAALADGPAYASPWREAIAFDLARGDPAAAAAVADRAVAVAGDERLASVSMQARASAATAGDLGPMAVTETRAASEQSRDATAMATLARVIRAAGNRYPWNLVADDLQATVAALGSRATLGDELLVRLESAQKRFPQFVSIGRTLVRQYTTAGEPREAARAARRLATAAPADAEAQRLAYAVCRDTGLYHEAETYALRWRRTYAGDAIWPDTAVADARVLLGQDRRALEMIEPHLAVARADVAQYGHLLGLAAEAYAAVGRNDDAFALVSPYLASNADWRLATMRLAGERVGDAAAARRWLERVEVDSNAAGAAATTRPVDDANRVTHAERLALAVAWVSVGGRLGDDDALSHGRAMLAELTGGPLTNDRAAWDDRARAAALAGDDADAEAAFRRVLALDPTRATAANELAYLLLRHDAPQTKAEALSWAKLATDQAPGQPAFQDTLARAYLAAGDLASAQAAFERALRLDDDYLDAMLGLAGVLNSTGQNDAAARLFARLKPVYQAAKPEPAHLRAEFGRLSDTFGDVVP